MNHIVERLAERFSPSVIASWMAKVIPNMITALLVLLVFWFLWKALERGVGVLVRRTKLDATMHAFLNTALKYAVVTVGLIAALGELGVDTMSLLASLGVAGLTIGFAARDALSNIISGIFIFWDRPFVVGDLIEMDGKYGRVLEITLRSTRVVTPDGKLLAIPNTNILNTTVASYTNFPHLRLDLDVTVGVSEDIGRIRSLLLDLVGDDERYLNEPAPDVSVTALNDYNVALLLSVWLDDEKAHLTERPRLREMIYDCLRTAGVDMPFETFQVQPIDLRQAVGERA